MGNYQARFWRAAALVRESLTLIIKQVGATTCGLGEVSQAPPALAV